MSNISFDSGDYNHQLNLGTTRDGLIYFNYNNRDIVIGDEEEFINFNTLPINDNHQFDNNDDYTYTSKYMHDNYITTVDANPQDYYTTNKAINIIGNTDVSMTNGYIKDKISTLINGIPYEAIIQNNGIKYVKTQTYNNRTMAIYNKTFTIYYPSIIEKGNFNMLLVFIYYQYDSKVVPIIHPIVKQEDMTLSYDCRVPLGSSDYIYLLPTTIYKAFWV